MANVPKNRVDGGVDATELHLDEVVSTATGEAARHVGGADDQSIGRAKEGLADANDYAEDLAKAKDDGD